MSHNRLPGAVWLLLLVLIPAPTSAQEPAAHLTLENALTLARQHNPDLRKAAHEVDRAAAGERAGWGAFLPRLRAGASLVDLSSRTMTGRNEFGQPVALENPAVFSATSAQGGVGASLTIFDGFRRVNELRAARAGSRMANAHREGEANRVEAEIRRRFYTALAAHRMVEVEARLLDAAAERLQATEAMVRAGRATPQDVLGGEVDLARQQMALDNAEADAYAAGLALQEVIGVSDPGRLRLVGEFPALVDPGELDAEALVAAAVTASPRAQLASASARRADHSADAIRSIRWPTVQLSAGMERAISTSGPDELRSFPWNRGTSAGISVSLPLFTGLSASAQIAHARATEAIAAEDVRKTRLAIEREVRTALTETGKAYRSVRLSERAAELSRRRRDVGQEGFRRGMVSFTELQQLIEQAAQTERAAVRAHMAYALAVATLEEAVGRNVTPGEGFLDPR